MEVNETSRHEERKRISRILNRMEATNCDRIIRYVVCYQWYAKQIANKFTRAGQLISSGTKARPVAGSLGGSPRGLRFS